MEVVGGGDRQQQSKDEALKVLHMKNDKTKHGNHRYITLMLHAGKALCEIVSWLASLSGYSSVLSDCPSTVLEEPLQEHGDTVFSLAQLLTATPFFKRLGGELARSRLAISFLRSWCTRLATSLN